MPKMRMLLIPIILVSGACFGNEDIAPWPEGAKREVINGCRASIWDLAAKDFLKRQGLDVLPDDFHERTQAQMEPFLLASCDCTTTMLSKELTIEAYVSDPERRNKRGIELLNGPCAVGKFANQR